MDRTGAVIIHESIFFHDDALEDGLVNAYDYGYGINYGPPHDTAEEANKCAGLNLVYRVRVTLKECP